MKIKILCPLIAAFFVVAANAQNALKVQAGTTLNVTGGAVITLNDMNLDNSGSINLAPGNGTFAFTGTAANNISGAALPSFDILQINKTGAGLLTINRDINVSGAIKFTAGNINLNTHHILLQPAALLTGENEASRISGATGGFVEITNTLNAPSAANPGNLGAIISSAANLGSTVIRRGHQSQTGTGIAGNSILRYFDITPTNNTGLNATLRINYLDAELNGLAERTLEMFKSADNIIFTAEGFASRQAATNYVEKAGITDFSRWTLAFADVALPVEFVLFNVKCNDNKVAVNWSTATEQNSSYFEVQRSNNSLNWITVGQVQAAGNSSAEINYSFTDNSPLAGIAFYRIAEFDMDSRLLYSGIIKNRCEQNNTWKVWPNPVHDKLLIDLNTANSTRITIRIFDSKGALVREQHKTLPVGSNQFSVSFNQLTKGLYHVVAEWDNGNNKKVIQVIRE